MRCPNPKTNGTRGTHPCGGCLICRKNKGRFWTGRLLLEQMSTVNTSWFLTLTYDDEHLPRTVFGDGTLRKKYTTQWVQDQRKVHDFRYYLVGEYGEKTKRPHYHMAVFPPDSAFSVDRLLAAWKKGHTSYHMMETGSAEYLAKYTLKKLTRPDDPRLLEGQEPEFRTSSRAPALGSAAIEKLASAYETKSGSRVVAERGDVERTLRIGRKKYPLDPYVLRKLRERLGIPQTHEERLTHEGYYQWHQVPEMEKDLPKLEIEEHRHAQKIAKNTRPWSL